MISDEMARDRYFHILARRDKARSFTAVRKGMIVCPECGGKLLPPIIKSAELGMKMRNRFCPSCGQRIDWTGWAEYRLARERSKR